MKKLATTDIAAMLPDRDLELLVTYQRPEDPPNVPTGWILFSS